MLFSFQEVPTSQMLDHGSISFGRFAHEHLSWEKRSVFTFNKCQEELEKFKSPGLVAKKKAYFEEYYKRIRAMKSLQESHQTEITLDYDGDGSISSQTGEEAETKVQLEHLGGGVARDVVIQPEGVSIAVSMEKGTGCNEAREIQFEHSDPEVISPGFDSSRNSTEEHEDGDKAIGPSEITGLDITTSEHESLALSMEEPEQHNLSDIDDKGVPSENSISDKNIEPEVASGEKPLCLINSKKGEVEVKPATKTAPGKAPIATAKGKAIALLPKVCQMLEHLILVVPLAMRSAEIMCMLLSELNIFYI